MKSASPRCEPSKRAGRTTLRIQNAVATPASTASANTSTSAMNQPCEPSHGNDQLRSTAEIIAITIVGKRTRKPQKIAACIAPGSSRWNSLRCPSTITASLRTRRGDVVVPLDRLPRAHEPTSSSARRANSVPATASSAASASAPASRRYCPRAFLSSAEIAGTISCRFPTTA